LRVTCRTWAARGKLRWLTVTALRVRSSTTVRNTGRAFVNPEAHVWTIRDGKLARFQSYHDTAAAAAAHRVQ
jgi:ketosteroid isomerase-like protein